MCVGGGVRRSSRHTHTRRQNGRNGHVQHGHPTKQKTKGRIKQSKPFVVVKYYNEFFWFFSVFFHPVFFFLPFPLFSLWQATARAYLSRVVVPVLRL